MKKVRVLGLAVLMTGLLSGCEKFSPEETAISVNKDGEIVSFITESFEKDYYRADELEASIDQAIYNYNEQVGGENIEKKKFEVKDQAAKLTINYASGEDYARFNGVTLFAGDVLGAYNVGYDFKGGFQSVDKGTVIAPVTGNEILNSYNYGIVILEENIEVKVPGNIVYVSDNVEVTGKKTARVASAKSTGSETALQQETDANGALSIMPVSSSGVENTSGLAYILYD